jgi:hypothetical protein
MLPADLGKGRMMMPLDTYNPHLLLGAIEDAVNMAPNDDPLPHIRECIHRWRDRLISKPAASSAIEVAPQDGMKSLHDW